MLAPIALWNIGIALNLLKKKYMSALNFWPEKLADHGQNDQVIGQPKPELNMMRKSLKIHSLGVATHTFLLEHESHAFARRPLADLIKALVAMVAG